jgi:hypothetical protein
MSNLKINNNVLITNSTKNTNSQNKIIKSIIKKDQSIYNFHNISRKFKIAVWGWTQGQNLGDDWISQSIQRRFPGIIPITTEIEDFSIYNFVIIGGGGLLNGPKLRSPFNKPLSVQYGSFGLGGEFEITEKDELKKLINLSKFFGVRDTRNLSTFNIEGNRRLEISGDCTFLYPLTRMTPNKKIIKIKIIWRDPYGLQKWHTSKHHTDDGEQLNTMFKEYIGPIPLDDNEKALGIYKDILRNYGTVIFDNYRVTQFKIDDLYDRFMQIDLVVTMRYHGVVAAIQLGIPCIAIDIYPKVKTIMTEAGLDKYCIKVGEFQKISGLIQNIKIDWDNIRLKMSEYTKKQTIITNRFANKAEQKMIYLAKRNFGN